MMNIANCIIFFEKFKVAQSDCYYGDDIQDYHKKVECMAQWTNEPSNVDFWSWYADLNGRMILPLSEMLAIIPYLLRSLRIQKMFEAREIYCV